MPVAAKHKWIRITMLAVSLVLLLIVLLSGVGVAMFKSQPAWYGAAATEASGVTPVQRETLARTAENKLIDAQNWAAELRADEVRAAHYKEMGTAAAPAPRANGSHVIEVTQQELNALFDKWSTLYGWRAKYDQYVDDPRIVLHDGNLILAGKLKEFGAVGSFQFRPSVDDAGQLHLDLVHVMAGRLPLPDMVWTAWRDPIVASLHRHLPEWQASAKIAPDGSANFAAMAATLGKLMLMVVQRSPADPILFLPLADRGESVPVRVKDVSVEEGKLTLSVEPLSASQRAELLARIRSNQP